MFCIGKETFNMIDPEELEELGVLFQPAAGTEMVYGKNQPQLNNYKRISSMSDEEFYDMQQAEL